MVLWAAELWLYAGVAVAIVFLVFGIDRVEENARGAYLFRPLLIPGIVLLWPLVLVRWAVVESQGYDAIRRDRPVRDSHAVVWWPLAAIIPLVLVGALLVKQSPPPPGEGAVQLDQPAR